MWPVPALMPDRAAADQIQNDVDTSNNTQKAFGGVNVMGFERTGSFRSEVRCFVCIPAAIMLM